MTRRSVITVPLICQAHSLPAPTAEYRFCERRWRFDFAWLTPWKVALEVEGGLFMQGRHSRGAGMLNDIAKYNEAVLEGWKVLRCTPKDVESGAVAELLKRALL